MADYNIKQPAVDGGVIATPPDTNQQPNVLSCINLTAPSAMVLV
jgi:hypothetical protein